MMSPTEILSKDISGNVKVIIWLAIMALFTFLAIRLMTQRTRRQRNSGPAIFSNVTLAQKPVLTTAEAQFFKVLQVAVGNDYLIFPQLPIWTILEPRGQDPTAVSVMNNRISLKRIDFLLVEAQTLRPYLAIELDDHSHASEKGQKRDAFVDEVFQRAGLPLIHIRGAATYKPETIRKQLGLTVCEQLSA